MTIPAGATIGSVVVEEKLSSGADGEVFLARQPGLERPVLLRRVRRDLLASRGIGEQFRREARLAARVLHPNVVQVFDLFADRGDYYLVLERVDGPSLRAILDQARRIPVPIAVRIAVEIARGLEEIQRRGIVHGDLRAENVLVSRWGEVKIMGLGGAREVGDSEPPSPREITACTAPEIQQGREARAEADVYSLAALLCELITGRPGAERLIAAIGLRPRLAHVLARSASERPESRPTLAQLRRALERASSRGEPDHRIEIAAWMWEVRTLRPPAAALEEPEDTPEPGARAAWRWRPDLSHLLGQRDRLLPLAAVLGVLVALTLVISGRDEEASELPSVDSPPPAQVQSPPPAAAPAAPAAKTPQTSAPVEPAQVSFVVVPWAEIQIDDQPSFFTPRARPAAIEPGEHVVVLRHPSFGEVRRTLELRAGEKKVVRHVFERATP